MELADVFRDIIDDPVGSRALWQRCQHNLIDAYPYPRNAAARRQMDQARIIQDAIKKRWPDRPTLYRDEDSYFNDAVEASYPCFLVPIEVRTAVFGLCQQLAPKIRDQMFAESTSIALYDGVMFRPVCVETTLRDDEVPLGNCIRDGYPGILGAANEQLQAVVASLTRGAFPPADVMEIVAMARQYLTRTVVHFIRWRSRIEAETRYASADSDSRRRRAEGDLSRSRCA